MDSKLKAIFEESNKLSEQSLSKYACKDDNVRRLKPETTCKLRSSFAVDRDRILYSGAYRRYQGKTQVFSFTNMFDEEMTNRSLHTTYVSQTARTIAKMLKLNRELIEAIALGHDLGHTPFGHEGERALDECCLIHNIGNFKHNIASLFIVDHITNRGRGLNLTFPVRDGIVSHDGEIHQKTLTPNREKTEEEIKLFVLKSGVGRNAVKDKRTGQIREDDRMPATMEGCVVRMSDTIAYIGKDIEDAIRSGILKREELPPECVAYFGNTNSSIINTLICDVILNSYEKDYISLSDTASHHLSQLKHFNYERIYKNPSIKSYTDIVCRSMKILFDKYLEDISNNRTSSKIFYHFLNHKSKTYLDNFTDEEKVRDFIATMTDRYFNEEIKDYLLPGKY